MGRREVQAGGWCCSRQPQLPSCGLTCAGQHMPTCHHATPTRSLPPSLPLTKQVLPDPEKKKAGPDAVTLVEVRLAACLASWLAGRPLRSPRLCCSLAWPVLHLHLSALPAPVPAQRQRTERQAPADSFLRPSPHPSPRALLPPGPGVQVGPRACLQPIKMFAGSFGGPVIYENPDYVSPNLVRGWQQHVA